MIQLSVISIAAGAMILLYIFVRWLLEVTGLLPWRSTPSLLSRWWNRPIKGGRIWP